MKKRKQQQNSSSNQDSTDDLDEFYQMAKVDDQVNQVCFIRRITMLPTKFPSGMHFTYHSSNSFSIHTPTNTLSHPCIHPGTQHAKDAIEIISQDAIIHHFASQFGEVNPVHTQINVLGDNSILISVAFIQQESFVNSANYDGIYGIAQATDTAQTPLQAALKRGFFVTDTLSSTIPSSDQVAALLTVQLQKAFPSKVIVSPTVKKNSSNQYLVSYILYYLLYFHFSVNLLFVSIIQVYFQELVHLFYFMEHNMVSQVNPYLKCVPSLSTTNVPEIFRLFCHIDYPHLITNSQIRFFLNKHKGCFMVFRLKQLKPMVLV
jgi:hypothetical protein